MMSDEDIKEFHNIGKKSGLKKVTNTTICKENRSRILIQENEFMK